MGTWRKWIPATRESNKLMVISDRRILRPLRLALALALAFPAGASLLWGQDPSPVDSLAAEEGDTLKSSFIPLPVVFYQPETGFGFGATAVYSFYLGQEKDAEEGERILSSTIAPVALYTTKSQIIVALRAELFPIGSPYRMLG